MSQHFLLTAAARTLSLSAVARMSDEEAHARFVAIRWADNQGQPYCPKCGCLKVYAYAARRLWKCAGCRYQFSVTARTIFADRKRSIRDYLLAIAIFANGAKGHSALQLSRDLDCQYRTAYVLAHKLRESLGSVVHGGQELSGEVQVDGMYAGGHRKPENKKADRVDRRLAEEQTGKRQVVVVAREVLGRTLPFVVPQESAAVPLISRHVASGAIIHAAARAKTPSGTGDDDRTDAGVAAQALQRLVQALQHRRRERVQPIGSIEGQPRDPVFPGFQQVGHLGPIMAAPLPRRWLIVRRRIIVG